MAFTARELIIESYYLAGIYARDYETLSDSDLNDGLNRLNDFIAIKGAQTKLIPYYTIIDGVFEPSEEKFHVSGLIEVDTFTFFLPAASEPNSNPVRLQQWRQSRQEFFGTARATNIDAIPIYWHLERVLGGCDLYVYPKPSQDYPYQITGKISPQPVAINQDLDLFYDKWYLLYLKYGLCIYLCEWRNIITPQTIQKTFDEIEAEMTTLSPLDFSLRKVSYFGQGSTLTVADATFRNVWRP